MVTSDAAWDRAAYPAAAAGRLVGLSPTRVRRWLQGYDFTYEGKVHHQRPVVSREGTAGTTYASFLDLIDLLFVKRFIDYGISLQRVRRALAEAAQILGTNHFARSSFFTDGHNVYLELQDRGDAILELLSGGQWVIAPIIQQLAEQIDFDAPTGIARRWYPRGPGGLVVLDPLVSFGQPSVIGRGVTTANVFDLYVAEGRRTGPVSDWMCLGVAEVEAAVEFERRLVA